MNTHVPQNIHVGVDTGKAKLDSYIRPLDLIFTTIEDLPQNHAKRFNSLTLATGSQFTCFISL
jgi:hypothetical protein